MKGKVLVAGASGVVGHAAVKHFAATGDWDVIGVSRRRPLGLEALDRVTWLAVDLTDRAACERAFSRLADVTHVVYAALFEKPGLVEGWRERDQMDTNLAMLRNLFDPLLTASRPSPALRHVSLLQGTKAYGVHIERVPVPAKERWPRHQHENFYFLQEDHLRSRQEGAAWTLTILRPQIIFGESVGSHMNLIPAIGVYAAVQRAAGRPLSFPGGAAQVSEAVDADLLARSLEWAATSAAAADETFNITNGDVFEWRAVWPAIAEAVGMEPGPDQPRSLATEMPTRAAEWAAIVERHHLSAPADLDAFVGQSFIYADRIFRHGVDRPSTPQLVSTIKLRQAGFGECVDTEDMFRRVFRVLQDRRLLPPR